MPSKFGDFAAGRYNVLPTTGSVPYTAPGELSLSHCPYVGQSEDKAAMDLHVQRSEAEKETSLADAYSWFEKNPPKAGLSFDPGKAVVHASWGEWLSGTSDFVKLGYLGYGLLGRALLLNNPEYKVAVIPAGVFGRLVGVAPLVCSGTPYEGQVSLSHEESASVTVSETVEQTHEFGLEAGGSVEYEGIGVHMSGHESWSKSVSHSKEVTKSFSNSQTFDIPEKTWGRVDLRICAGVYVGWLAVTGFEDH